METYVQPIINDDTPEVVILHIGCKDTSIKYMPADDIAKGIISIWYILQEVKCQQCCYISIDM